MSKNITFGEHLTVDGYGGSFDLLKDSSLIERCLETLPKMLGMRKLSDIAVHWAQPNGIRDPGGWSGYVLIAESHISIHTFPHRKFLSADVYTCRSGLDRDRVVNYLTECFNLADTEVNFLYRGTKYPACDIVEEINEITQLVS